MRLSPAPTSDKLKVQIATIRYDLAIAYLELARSGLAEQQLRKALSLLRSRAETHSLVPACMNRLGILYLDDKRIDLARTFFEEAEVLRLAWQMLHPEDEANVVYLGGTRCNLGHALRESGRTAEALAYYLLSIETLDARIPGCTCGCRDMYASMLGEHVILTAQRFLRNALEGRAACLREAPRLHLLRSMFERGLKVLALDSRASRLDTDALRELRVEFLDAVTLEQGPFLVDLTEVGLVPLALAELLIHLRGRTMGSGQDVAFVGPEAVALSAIDPKVRSEIAPWFPSREVALAAMGT